MIIGYTREGQPIRMDMSTNAFTGDSLPRAEVGNGWMDMSTQGHKPLRMDMSSDQPLYRSTEKEFGLPKDRDGFFEVVATPPQAIISGNLYRRN